jgi:hypothetical protein
MNTREQFLRAHFEPERAISSASAEVEYRAREQNITETLAYPILLSLGVVNKDGTSRASKKSPMYIKGHNVRGNYWVYYRVTDVDDYQVHMQFVPSTGGLPKAAREPSPTMATSWTTWKWYSGTEKEFWGGSEVDGT